MSARGGRTAERGASREERGASGVPTAVVTGASRGIGRAIALRLAPRYHVVAVARTVDALDALAAEITARGGACTPCPLDITDAAAVERALQRVSADVLVNNAGVMVRAPLLDLTPDAWRRMMAVNLDAVYTVTRVLLPGMVERRRGHIVNIGSLAGRNPFVGGTGYTATKYALVGFTESLMLEVRAAGVRVSLVMPGSVDTDLMQRSGDRSWMLTADDVAAAVAHVLEAPANALVSRVELRPAVPPSS
ncbi:MAG TPA: SDR family NAD(P)-dependent oxidoreductase [Gemmatimonadaceae bacterium]|nr:SDR family NAD(P)-dependent oxidoreductase [Gemmatimonadaceae bacterium]